jgi:hypothetical protein
MKTGEIDMQDLKDNEDSQEETDKEGNTQNTMLEDMEVDIKDLIVVHGKKEVKNMQVEQLRKLKMDLLKGKSKGINKKI